MFFLPFFPLASRHRSFIVKEEWKSPKYLYLHRNDSCTTACTCLRIISGYWLTLTRSEQNDGYPHKSIKKTKLENLNSFSWIEAACPKKDFGENNTSIIIIIISTEFRNLIIFTIFPKHFSNWKKVWRVKYYPAYHLINKTISNIKNRNYSND